MVNKERRGANEKDSIECFRVADDIGVPYASVGHGG